MNPESLIAIPTSVKGFFFAGGTLVADAAAQHVDGVPEWITALGLPTAFCICVIYALIASNNERKASEAGRLKDKDDNLEAMKVDAKAAAESRDRLVSAAVAQTAATAAQTVAMEHLTDEIRRSVINK